MSVNEFKKAIRKQVKIKAAITGPTGSGKTYSALRLATGMGLKIAVIDAENGSASLYSDKFDFDVLDIQPPYTTEKYIEALKMAEKGGYGVVIIDSLSHAWAGEGGLLEQKAKLDSRPGSNQWTNWGPITIKENALKNAYLHSNIHIIATMRSKMEYAQTESGGKKKIQKLGLAPIQREGVEYEFTIVFDVAINHETEVSKDRTGLFADKIFQITEETGKTIMDWLETGAIELIPEKKITTPPPVNNNDGDRLPEDQPKKLVNHAPDENSMIGKDGANRLLTRITKSGIWTLFNVVDYSKQKYKVDLQELTWKQAREFISIAENKAPVDLIEDKPIEDEDSAWNSL